LFAYVVNKMLNWKCTKGGIGKNLEENSTLPLASRPVDFQNFDYVATWREKILHW
jgi:hypothetical protein